MEERAGDRGGGGRGGRKLQMASFKSRHGGGGRGGWRVGPHAGYTSPVRYNTPHCTASARMAVRSGVGAVSSVHDLR